MALVPMYTTFSLFEIDWVWWKVPMEYGVAVRMEIKPLLAPQMLWLKRMARTVS